MANNDENRKIEDIKKIDDTIKTSFKKFHSSIKEYGKVGIESYFKNLSKNGIILILMLLALLTIVFLSYYDVFYNFSERPFSVSVVKQSFYLPLLVSIIIFSVVLKPKFFFKSLYTIIPLILIFYTIAFFSNIPVLSLIMIIVLGLCMGIVINSLVYVFFYYLNSKEKLLGAILFTAFICGLYLIKNFLSLFNFSDLIMRYILPIGLLLGSYIALMFKPEKSFDDITDSEDKLTTPSLVIVICIIALVFINEGIFQGIRSNINFDSIQFSNNAYSLGFIVSILYIIVAYIFLKNANYIMILSYLICIIATYEFGLIHLLFEGSKLSKNIFEGAMGITSPIGITAALMICGKLLEDNRSIKYSRILTITIGIFLFISRIIDISILKADLRLVMVFALFAFLFFTAFVFIFNIRNFLTTSKPEEKVEEIQKYVNPDDVLTKKEKVVFELLLEGLTLRQIAGELACKYDAVNFHYKNIYRKLEVNSKIELIIRYGKN